LAQALPLEAAAEWALFTKLEVLEITPVALVEILSLEAGHTLPQMGQRVTLVKAAAVVAAQVKEMRQQSVLEQAAVQVGM
jgi:hypothetical protein